MKILFVLHTYPPESWGGTELHAQAIARILSPEHEVRIFCRGGDPARPQGALTSTVQEGVEVVRFNNLYQDFVGFESTYLHEGAHEAFLAQLDEFQPELIHVHHLTGLSTTIVEAAKARNYPVVLSLHDFWMVCPRGQRLHPEGGICEVLDRDRCQNCLHHLWPGWLEERPEGGGHEEKLDRWDAHTREIFRLCDLILTPSRFHRERMIEDGGISPRTIRALPHGLDHELFAPGARRGGRVRTIGYIGAVIPTKGVHVLVEAFELLAAPGLELEIWGDAPIWHEEKDYLGELRTLAGPRVHFLGHYDHGDLPGILAQIDILVVPSLWWETFSLTIREAMLAEIPVVASDLGAMREALQDVEAGLLFPAGNAEALAGVLDELIRSPELRRRCASHRDSVKTIERNAADYLILYDEAIEIAEQRRDLIEVKPSSFPEKKPADAAAPGAPKDLRVSIEKIGRGDVRVSSAVERGEQTRVSFVFDYGPSDEAAEVRLTVDFGAGAASVESRPTAPARQPAPIPVEAEDSAAKIVASMTPEAEAQAREEALYKLDQDIFPAQVNKMDEMVGQTHLEDEEQVPRSRRPRREDERDQDRPGPRARDEERPRRPEADDERPRRRRERSGRDDADRGERRPRRDAGEDRPRRGRDDRPPRGDDRPPRRDDRPPRREENPQAGRPAPKKPAAPPQSEAKPHDHGDGEVVWDGGGVWQLPEGSEVAAPPKPERAPHHRTGRQPTVKPTKPGGGGFGEGL